MSEKKKPTLAANDNDASEPRDKEPISDEQLDSIASPHDYFDTHIVMTSRGCPWRCTFCGAEASWGRGYRAQSVTYVLDARESMARQITETARLNEELSKSQLAALRRQIEPHFMYNTLNSIAGLVRDHRNDAAVSMIVGLSEFLRRSSEDSHRSQVALREEVEYLQRYLEIQKVRFGERLQVSVDIPPELLCAQVPNLLLQPLVENAIKHGIAKRVAGGNVRVAGACHNGNLCLSVYNDGPSLPADWQATPTGVGIANLRTRLQILHGNVSELRLQRANPGGVEVLVTLPFTEV